MIPPAGEIPPQAITIWSAGPSIVADLSGHRIIVPATAKGISLLLNLIAMRTPKTTIAEKGDPTQWQVDRDLLSKIGRGPKPRPAVDEAKVAIMRSLGMLCRR